MLADLTTQIEGLPFDIRPIAQEIKLKLTALTASIDMDQYVRDADYAYKAHTNEFYGAAEYTGNRWNIFSERMSDPLKKFESGADG